VESAAVIETGISVLFFYGERVYKVRKPVTTPFLDFSTRELRLADCRREVALNRRLAPDVYLGVLDVVDEAGRPCDHLVVMRRLPGERRLSTLIAEPGSGEAQVVAVARLLAGFHARAQRSADIDAAGSTEHLAMLWGTNLTETAPYTSTALDGALHERVAVRGLDYLAGRHPLLRRRIAEGRIVDGHGDLLAADIFCLDDGPRILDCIEFADRFRWGDVLYDTSFLAMDLQHRGRPDLARRFLEAYREFSAENHPASLEHWYIAYRALVRCKIACLRGDEQEAAALLELAARNLAEAQVHLVLVGGLPGSGKSTVADGLSDRLRWPVLRSDEIRKEIAGLGHTDRATAEPFEGIYAPQRTAAVYRELRQRAGLALSHGESVILDATWLDSGERAAAHALAAEHHAQIDEVRCVLDPALAADRVQRRAAAGDTASDATAAVVRAMAAQAETPWPHATAIDTRLPVATAVGQTVAAIRPDLLSGPV
jgi:hypothetical protein